MIYTYRVVPALLCWLAESCAIAIRIPITPGSCTRSRTVRYTDSARWRRAGLCSTHWPQTKRPKSNAAAFAFRTIVLGNVTGELFVKLPKYTVHWGLTDTARSSDRLRDTRTRSLRHRNAISSGDLVESRSLERSRVRTSLPCSFVLSVANRSAKRLIALVGKETKSLGSNTKSIDVEAAGWITTFWNIGIFKKFLKNFLKVFFIGENVRWISDYHFCMALKPLNGPSQSPLVIYLFYFILEELYYLIREWAKIHFD